MARTRVETRARARALQALYAWDLRGGRDLDRVASQVWDDLSVPPEERRIAGLLVRTIIAEGEALDIELAEVTTNWRLERLGAIERSVLRLAAAELQRAETPPRVVIKEAMHLAERYGTEQSAKFVNGVLDALARRMGRLPASGR
jgi:transcription antitermination protein NusB